MNSHRRSGAVLMVATLATCLLTTPLRAQTVPTGFAFELVVTGPFASDPSAFTFLPDRRILMTERGSGNVRLAAVGAPTSVVIATIPNVSTQVERGLLGVAVDPQWPTRPYVYFSYTRTNNTSVIQMYTASGQLTDPASTAITLSSPYELLETTDFNVYHNSGTVRFGRDGRLYATWGDDGTPCNGQDLTSLNGKVLRLSVASMPGAGPGPPAKSLITPTDNPFFSNPSENARLVYAWGLRNPFRFNFDPVNGDLYLGDVGEDTWEEIDLIAATTHGGQNLGWPVREGPGPGGGATCGQTNAFTEPIAWYPHVPENPTAVIAGPLYRSVAGGFPAYYEGSYFFLDWGAGWIRRLVKGPTGWQTAPAVPGQPTADRWATNLLYFSDFQEGPDGSLYLMRHGGAWGLYRIRRVLPTSAPLVASSFDVQAQPNPARAGSGVDFAWTSPHSGRVSLRVFDAMGRLVTALGSESEAERGVLRWNARDVSGAPMAGGVYFYRLDRSDGTTAAGRVTLLR